MPPLPGSGASEITRISSMPRPKNEVRVTAMAESTASLVVRTIVSVQKTASVPTTTAPRMSRAMLRPSRPRPTATKNAIRVPGSAEWDTTSESSDWRRR